MQITDRPMFVNNKFTLQVTAENFDIKRREGTI